MKKRQDEIYADELRKEFGMKTEKEIERDRKIMIKRFRELEGKHKLTYKENKERTKLIDGIVVFYDSKTHRTHISGAGIVALWYRGVVGEKKWKLKAGPETEQILKFEKRYNVRLFCKDLDESSFGMKEAKG